MTGERLCLWCGPLFVLMFGLGIVVLAGWLPPPGPGLEAGEVAQMFASQTTSIRLGIAFMALSAGILIAFAGLVSAEMRRIPGCGAALGYTQLACAAVVAVIVMMCAAFWGWAAFRPERAPELTLMIHDLAWLSLLTTVSAPAVQPASVGLAILGDRSADPRYPRWAGFVNLWIAVLLVPGVLALFFKKGPFAWDGLFVFYIPFAVFGAWFFLMFFLMRSRLGTESQ